MYGAYTQVMRLSIRDAIGVVVRNSERLGALIHPSDAEGLIQGSRDFVATYN